MNVENPALYAVAHHEAGHATMALRLARRFRYVTIEQNEQSFGRIHPWRKIWKPGSDASSERRMQHEVMIRFAGAIAEQKYTGAPNDAGAKDDRQQAIDLLTYFCESEPQIEAYAEYLHIRAEEEFELPVVQAVHAALVSELLQSKTVFWQRALEIRAKAIADLVASRLSGVRSEGAGDLKPGSE